MAFSYYILNYAKVGFSLERTKTRKQLVKNNACGKNVCSRIDWQSLYLFRGHIFESANDRSLSLGYVLCILHSSHAEISKFYLSRQC